MFARQHLFLLPTPAQTSLLTVEQAYEAAYRFVAQYYERERIVPLMLMLTAMTPTTDRERTNDPASWPDLASLRRGDTGWDSSFRAPAPRDCSVAPFAQYAGSMGQFGTGETAGESNA
jgi:hypothetical protein